MKTICTLLLLVGLSGNIFSQCPTISKQPLSQTDCDGNSIRMIVESNATSVQWEKKRPTDANFSTISGATSSNYQINPTGGTNYPDGTKLRAKLQSGTCTIYSDEATINLSSITTITGTTICERSNGELLANLSVGGQSKAIQYQWSTSINGGAYQDIANGSDFDGANTQKLILKNASLNNQSQKFKVKVEFQISPNNDNEGSLTNLNQTPTCPRTSSEYSVTIKTSPIPSHSVTNYNACAGSNVTVSSTGCSPYTTLWYNSKLEKIGEGARPTLLFQHSGIELIKATCLKSGCESLPSSGTTVTVNEIPSAVSNNGTVSNVNLGLDVTFKATGGVNNIWYLKETDNSPISTASTITVKNVQTDGSIPYYLSRWVSQKINGCEGPKTEIRVLVNDPNNVKTNLTPSVDPVAISTTPEKELPTPIIVPEPIIQVEEPVAVETPIVQPEIPEILPETSISPTIEPAPIPEKLVVWYSKDCEKQEYVVSGRNCPESIDYINSDTRQLIENVPNGQNFRFDGSINQRIIARCNAPNFEDYWIQVEAFKKSNVKMEVAKNHFCEGDSMTITTNPLDASKFLGWEKDAHILSMNSVIKVKADSNLYWAVYQLNDCQFRIPSPIIVVSPIPKKPRISYLKNTFCPGENIEISADELAKKYHWTTHSTQQKIRIQQSTTIALQTENEFGCVSQLSDSVRFTMLPKGEKPILSSKQLQFCDGDTLSIISNKGDNTIWNNGFQGKEMKTTKSGKWYAISKSGEGCMSDTSEVLTVITRNKPQMPSFELPFNRILRGVRKAAGDSLIWKISEDNYLFNKEEITIKKPTLVGLRSMNSYVVEGNNILHCFSNYYEQLIDQFEPFEELEIFPNPSIDKQINIKTSVPFEKGRLRIIDLRGEIIYEKEIQNLQNSLTEKFEFLNTGTYFLQIDTGAWIGQKRLFIGA